MKIRENLTGLLKGVCVTLATASAFGIVAWHSLNNSNYLKPEDFNNAKWIPFYNENGRIWTCYMNEKIPHNPDNWYTYIKKVEKKNQGRLEGDILLPDLDKNRKVGK